MILLFSYNIYAALEAVNSKSRFSIMVKGHICFEYKHCNKLVICFDVFLFFKGIIVKILNIRSTRYSLNFNYEFEKDTSIKALF